MRLSTDMSEFLHKDAKKPDEWADLREVYHSFQNELTQNHSFWLNRRKRGMQRVQRYQNMYGRKRLY